MKKAGFITLGIVFLGLILFFSLKNGSEKGKKVQVEAVEKGSIQVEVSASGEIQPKTRVNVQSDITAKILELYFQEGDWVEKGQKLARLDDRTLTFQRDQAKASVEVAEAEVKRSKAVYEEAKRQYDYYEKLFKENLISENQWQEIQASLKQAEASLESSQKSWERAKASLDELETQLTKTIIYAPMSGRVVSLNMEEGEVVVMGTTNIPGSVIAVIADMKDILAEVDVVESDVTKLKEGMPAEVTVDALPDVTFQGEIVEIAHSAFLKMDVPYFKVKIHLDNPEEGLRPGMSARAKILVQKKEDIPVLPIQAIQKRDEKEGVFLYKRGKAVFTPVQTGLSDNHHIEIVEGVKVGDEIIVGPARVLASLKGQDRVEKEEKKSTP